LPGRVWKRFKHEVTGSFSPELKFKPVSVSSM
jgi:hypothetical protein